MRNRWIAAPLLAASLALLVALPVAAKEFGTVYVRGRPIGRSVIPLESTRAPAATTHFVYELRAGWCRGVPAGQGLTWWPLGVCTATWTDLSDARLVTDFDDALALAAAGQLTIVRAPEADFRCPLLPGNAHGTR